MLDSLWNPEKRGTLIFSTYRSGTHFLQQAIYKSIRKTNSENYSVTFLGEFLPDLTQLNIDQLNSKPFDYVIGIINSSYSKFFLTGDHSDLKNWHIVHLTRNDKVSHFISEWVWRQNPTNGQGMIKTFKHHGGVSQDYTKLLNNKTHYDLTQVANWLKEELINYQIPNTVRIDYSQLQSLDPEQWIPNQYNLQLSDLFTNHAEIENLLKNYKI